MQRIQAHGLPDAAQPVLRSVDIHQKATVLDLQKVIVRVGGQTGLEMVCGPIVIARNEAGDRHCAVADVAPLQLGMSVLRCFFAETDV